MNRDSELCLTILKYIESASANGSLHSPFNIDGYDDTAILTHIELLINEGLVEGKVFLGLFGPFLATVTKLTADGQEALRTARLPQRVQT